VYLHALGDRARFPDLAGDANFERYKRSVYTLTSPYTTADDPDFDNVCCFDQAIQVIHLLRLVVPKTRPLLAGTYVATSEPTLLKAMEAPSLLFRLAGSTGQVIGKLASNAEAIGCFFCTTVRTGGQLCSKTFSQTSEMADRLAKKASNLLTVLPEGTQVRPNFSS